MEEITVESRLREVFATGYNPVKIDFKVNAINEGNLEVSFLGCKFSIVGNEIRNIDDVDIVDVAMQKARVDYNNGRYDSGVHFGDSVKDLKLGVVPGADMAIDAANGKYNKEGVVHGGMDALDEPGAGDLQVSEGEISDGSDDLREDGVDVAVVSSSESGYKTSRDSDEEVKEDKKSEEKDNVSGSDEVVETKEDLDVPL